MSFARSLPAGERGNGSANAGSAIRPAKIGEGHTLRGSQVTERCSDFVIGDGGIEQGLERLEFAKVDRNQFASRTAHGREGSRHRAFGRSVDRREEGFPWHADPQAVEFDRLDRVLATGEDAVQELQIGDSARHRSKHVACRRQSDGAAPRVSGAACAKSDDAAERGRNAKGAASVAAEARVRQAGSNRGGRAATRTPGYAVGVSRVAYRAEPGIGTGHAEAHLVHVCFADDHEPGLFQEGHDGALARGTRGVTAGEPLRVGKPAASILSFTTRRRPGGASSGGSAMIAFQGSRVPGEGLVNAGPVRSPRGVGPARLVRWQGAERAAH